MSSRAMVARRYAEAFIAVAQQQQVLDEACCDIKLISRSVVMAPELLMRLRMPSLSKTQKQKVLKRVVTGVVEPLTLQLIEVLVKRGRVDLLPEMSDAVQEERDRIDLVTKVTVSSAVLLGNDERDAVEQKVRKLFGPTARTTYSINASLIAGYKITTADRTIDCSVRSRLDHLKEQLLHGA